MSDPTDEQTPKESMTDEEATQKATEAEENVEYNINTQTSLYTYSSKVCSGLYHAFTKWHFGFKSYEVSEVVEYTTDSVTVELTDGELTLTRTFFVDSERSVSDLLLTTGSSSISDLPGKTLLLGPSKSKNKRNMLLKSDGDTVAQRAKYYSYAIQGKLGLIGFPAKDNKTVNTQQLSYTPLAPLSLFTFGILLMYLTSLYPFLFLVAGPLVAGPSSLFALFWMFGFTHGVLLHPIKNNTD